VVTSEVPPLLVIELLHRVVDIFTEYFESISPDTLKDNFSTVYQLLEEMLDNGYPLTTEPNALKAMIQPPTAMGRVAAAVTGKSGVSDVLPDGTISSMPWRKANVKYTQNEIYLDVVEEIDAIVDPNGQIVSSEVSGTIFANSRLSGVPDLTLGFQDPDVIDDCSFHPCVRYNRYERDKVVSFVPPDGQFELMKYRVNAQSTVSGPIYCQPQITYADEHNSGHGRLTINVGIKPMSSVIVPNRKSFAVEDIVVTIPFPRSVRTTNLTANVGSCLYDEAQKVATWTIGKMNAGSTGRSPTLSGTMVLHGDLPEESPPLTLTWKVPTASVSGLAVSSLQISGESYRPYKGVRTITRSGRYQIRT
jgi:AP-3 complex subunit mu